MNSSNAIDKVKVSVVIPAYNAAHFVSAAIDSVLAQTFKDFEILVIDDGSTDETSEVLKAYSNTIRYLYKENGGVSRARNYGTEHAYGKYIAFLDADDLWLSEKLAKQVALMESNPEIGLCYTSAIVVDENLKEINRIEAENYDDACEGLLLNMNILILSSSLIRKEIIAKTSGFDSQFSTCADKEFWLRLSLLTKFAPVNEYLVKYREVTGSMSSNPSLSKRDTVGVLNKFFAANDLPQKYRKLKNRAFSNNLMVVSGEFLHNGKVLESLNCMLNAIRLYPTNIKRPLGLPFRFIKRLLPS